VAKDSSTASGATSGMRVDPARVVDCHARAGAARWRVTVARFQATLERAVAKRFDAVATSSQIDAFLDGLHLEDLALAVACADGDEEAWEAFVARYRADLRRAAAAAAGETDGDEIVDALFVDLFARGDAAARRRSLFEYFHGRSRLGTWLRALIAQRHIDRVRATRRLTPLDEVAEGDDRLVEDRPSDPDRARLVQALQVALAAALAALATRDRLRLAYYHADGLKLAAIGRLLSEHEATVSRKLQRTREDIRRRVDEQLVNELGLDADQLRQCYEYAIEDGGLDFGRLRLVEPVRDG
jgi:RNA polymerase sigma-70 factor, ECF subfamily